MNQFIIKQIDINDVRSILEDHRKELMAEIEMILSKSSQNPELVSRSKLLKILDCSPSWLSKVTTNGEMPSITIGGRVFYDLRELSKKNLLNRLAINKNDRRLK